MSRIREKARMDITLTPYQTFFILIERILGKGTSRALEYHLLKVLGRQNLEEAITTNPVKLYEAFRMIFGRGTDGLLLFLFEEISKQSSMDSTEPRRLLHFLKCNEKENWLAFMQNIEISIGGRSQKRFPQRKTYNILNIIVALPSQIISRLRTHTVNLKR